MTALYKANGTDNRNFEWLDLEWATYVNPLALLWLYYVLALESKFLLKPQVSFCDSDFICKFWVFIVNVTLVFIKC